MDDHTATEIAYKNGYKQGVIVGVQKIAKELKNYYNIIGGQTFGALVAYTIDQKVKEMLEEEK